MAITYDELSDEKKQAIVNMTRSMSFKDAKEKVLDDVQKKLDEQAAKKTAGKKVIEDKKTAAKKLSDFKDKKAKETKEPKAEEPKADFKKDTKKKNK